MIFRSIAVCALIGAAAAGPGRDAAADSATVAVAANFVRPLEEVERSFEARGDHRITIVSGSTGQLYAQIMNGAPFDVFLSADAEHVDRLIEAGMADAAERFTYAIGKLALFTRDVERFEPLTLDDLGRADYRWLAIANPELAPYGAAAEQTLRRLGIWEALDGRLVRGQSIAQTFALAETRNADLAFVALSQVIEYRGTAAHIEIPANLYEPIRQDAAPLKRASRNPAARELLVFLRSADARRTIERFGYGLP